MIYFFGDVNTKVFAVQTTEHFSPKTLDKLTWLFAAKHLSKNSTPMASLDAFFIGPRAAMITPWSTNATEITQNMGISEIIRIEEFTPVTENYTDFDPMISQKYDGLDQAVFDINIQPEAILNIDDIAAYNTQEGLALNDEEVAYLVQLSNKIKRPLTDSEVFGFSQVNSEHCRHKIFNGSFIIDGKTMPSSLFKLIRKTSEIQPK